MKKYPFLFIFLPLILSFTFPYLKDSNEIHGNITISNCQSTIIKGNGYSSDGIELMHSDDPMAQPNRNVIISMHPLNFKPTLAMTEDAYISQSQQTFIPNVLPVVVGSKVHFLNEDEFFHNVQSLAPGLKFSIGRRAPGISYSVKIKKTGVIDLSCDIHEHMNATILSFDTPYFCRLNEDGSYSIKNLPDGSYRLEVYHPFCNKITQEVEVSGDEIFEYNFHISNNP